MKKNIGVLSFYLVGLGVILGLTLLMLESMVWGFGYLGLVLVTIYVVLMSYCRKCPHSMNGSCHHGLPGRLAKKLPYKKTGKYTWYEVTLVSLFMAATFLMPLILLYVPSISLAIYLCLWLSGALTHRRKVCPNCYNRWCVVCPNRVQ